MLAAISTSKAADFVVENFESKTLGSTLDMKAWYPEDGNATVVANPTNASNKVANIVTSNWDAMLKLNVTLPSGTTLSDYDSFSFDVYIPSNSEDENPNYKNMNIYIDDEKKYEDEDYPKQAEIATWATRTYTIASLELTPEEASKNSFVIAFGMSTDKGNYFIDNVKFSGGGSTPPPSGGVLTLEDFEAKSLGSTLGLKAWYPEDDGSATVAADPANALNKVANIVTSNWDALLKLSVVLPSGKTLGDFEELLFDIYVPSNDADENPNYKKMNIYIDDEKKYEDEDYPKQADIATWATKTYSLDALALTPDEKAKSSFDLAIGMSTDKGNYYLDNIKLKEKTTGITSTATTQNKMYIVNNTLYLKNMQADNIAVFNLNGVMQASGQGLSSLDVSHLNAGIYIVKAIINGETIVSKIIK